MHCALDNYVIFSIFNIKKRSIRQHYIRLRLRRDPMFPMSNQLFCTKQILKSVSQDWNCVMQWAMSSISSPKTTQLILHNNLKYMLDASEWLDALKNLRGGIFTFLHGGTNFLLQVKRDHDYQRILNKLLATSSSHMSMLIVHTPWINCANRLKSNTSLKHGIVPRQKFNPTETNRAITINIWRWQRGVYRFKPWTAASIHIKMNKILVIGLCSSRRIKSIKFLQITLMLLYM